MVVDCNPVHRMPVGVAAGSSLAPMEGRLCSSFRDCKRKRRRSKDLGEDNTVDYLDSLVEDLEEHRSNLYLTSWWR